MNLLLEGFGGEKVDQLLSGKNETTIGVLVSKKTITKLNQKQNAKFSIQQLINANEQVKANLYFFSFNNVDYRNKCIKGTYYCYESLSWKQQTFPYPDVLYSRLRRFELKKGERLRNEVEQENITLINSKNMFDKWHIHTKLLKNNQIACHLPKTYDFNDDRLIQLLEESNQVYVKPRNGKLGNHIVRITKTPSLSFNYEHFSTKNGVTSGTLVDWEFLVHFLKSKYSRRQAIIQESVNSMRVNNNIVDFRAEIQRNGTGEIEVVAIFPRMASPNAHVTNLQSGATFYSFNTFTENIMTLDSKEKERLKQYFTQFVIKVHKEIESIYGPLGETAIDFVLDDNHHLWFLECNATSTKKAFLFEEESITKRAFINPLQYAQYLHANKAKDNLS